ncbi:IS66 family transposase, partial [Thiorhodococcus minor]|nr:IS66 family transposase [Thiorhodococcus minor]
MPHLSDHDLRQFDDAYLETLTLEQARALLGRALADLKTARERLGQNPSNSSCPPSSRAPWAGRDGSEGSTAQTPSEAESAAGDAEDTAPTDAPDEEGETPPAGATQCRRCAGRAGRRRGAKGHSRTQVLPIDVERPHAPSICAGCAQPLSEAHASRAHNARYELELTQPGAGATGLLLQQTKQTYLERQCPCGHWPRAEPGRCEEDSDWTVSLSEWHLAGALLVAFICALTQRMRLSRAKV